MYLEKYSIGIGDRFAHQGFYQLKALQKAKMLGINLVPIWNKSNREHMLLKSTPEETKIAADKAVVAAKWTDSYYLDADHINITNVDKFISSCNFFTIDVADYINKPAPAEELARFLNYTKKYLGNLSIPEINHPFIVTENDLQKIANKFLYAIQQANLVYQHILAKKGKDNFIVEVSMDEIDDSQTPIEMFFILKILAEFGVPIQTVAPKFNGKFLKGVDYLGDIEKFAQEFMEDVLVINYAIKEFGLPTSLKLSVHSGSDKFALYPIINKIITQYNCGIHLKTAGTTWLEEVIGLALAGGEALELIKVMYKEMYHRRSELMVPYSAVVTIYEEKLPTPEKFNKWTSDQLVRSLRHDQSDLMFDPNLRQFIHIGFRIAAEYKSEYFALLEKNAKIVGNQVTDNLFERHIKPLFGA